MSSIRRKFHSVALALCVVLVIACEEPSYLSGPSGFNNNQNLGYCTLEFTNETGYLLTHGWFEPTDISGIMKDLPELPIEHGDTRTMELSVGVYQMMVTNMIHHYIFTSYDHTCIKDQLLEVTATIDDLKEGMLWVINDSGFEVTSVLVASTEDLIFGDNLLDGELEDGEELFISTGPGRFYWLIEDSEGSLYFKTGHVYGSVDARATVHPIWKIDHGELCTLTLTNSTEVTLDHIHIMPTEPSEYYYDTDGVQVLSPSQEFFDSRGDLPDSETLDILLAPGSWNLFAYKNSSSEGLYEVNDLHCSNGQPMTATLNP